MSEYAENESQTKVSKLKKVVRFFKTRPLYLVAAVALLAGGLGLVGASAVSGDCSDNSIIRCGAFRNGTGPNQSNLNSNVSKYHSDFEIKVIYNHYGIDRSSLGSLPLGEVRADGTVWLNGKKVATNARSTGRKDASNQYGSSTPINLLGGVRIYERNTQVIFKHGSLQAWVKTDATGKFLYAVITSCGNPVVAKPVPPPPPPAPTGTVKCDRLTVTKIARTRFHLRVTSSKTGSAKFTGFIIDYGDGKAGGAKTTTGGHTFDHIYDKAGTYKVQAGALGTLNNKTIGDGGPTCAATITVIEAPQTPNYTIKKYVSNQDAQDNNSAVSVKANQEFNYKIVVANTGQVKLTNVKVWDILPSGVSYVDNTLRLENTAVSNDSDFFNSTKGVIVPSIDVGKSKEFTFRAVVKATATEVAAKCASTGTFYNNVAKANPAGQGQNLGEKQDPAVIKCKEITKLEKPAVDIEKDVSKYEVAVNEEFDWILKVTNNGNVDLKDVKVTDAAPANIEFISSPNVDGATVTVNASSFTAVIASLKQDEVKEFVIKSKVTKEVAGEIVNTACVDAPAVKGQGPDDTKDDCDDAPVTTPEENCPVVGKENLPKNSAECAAENCPISGLEQYDASNPLCQTTPLPGGEVPSTGGGELILMAVVALALGGGVYAYTFRGAKKA